MFHLAKKAYKKANGQPQQSPAAQQQRLHQQQELLKAFQEQISQQQQQLATLPTQQQQTTTTATTSPPAYTTQQSLPSPPLDQFKSPLVTALPALPSPPLAAAETQAQTYMQTQAATLKSAIAQSSAVEQAAQTALASISAFVPGMPALTPAQHRAAWSGAKSVGKAGLGFLKGRKASKTEGEHARALSSEHVVPAEGVNGDPATPAMHGHTASDGAGFTALRGLAVGYVREVAQNNGIGIPLPIDTSSIQNGIAQVQAAMPVADVSALQNGLQSMGVQSGSSNAQTTSLVTSDTDGGNANAMTDQAVVTQDGDAALLVSSPALDATPANTSDEDVQQDTSANIGDFGAWAQENSNILSALTDQQQQQGSVMDANQYTSQSQQDQPQDLASWTQDQLQSQIQNQSQHQSALMQQQQQQQAQIQAAQEHRPQQHQHQHQHQQMRIKRKAVNLPVII